MTFELYRSNDGQTISNSELFRVKTDTLQYAPWLEGSVSENRIMSTQDSLWDMRDIYRGSDGKLYTAASIYCLDDHFGDWAMWAEIEPREA